LKNTIKNCGNWKNYKTEKQIRLLAAGYNGGEANVSNLGCDPGKMKKTTQEYVDSIINILKGK